jgi:hypothetical protein
MSGPVHVRGGGVAGVARVGGIGGIARGAGGAVGGGAGVAGGERSQAAARTRTTRAKRIAASTDESARRSRCDGMAVGKRCGGGAGTATANSHGMHPRHTLPFLLVVAAVAGCEPGTVEVTLAGTELTGFFQSLDTNDGKTTSLALEPDGVDYDPDGGCPVVVGVSWNGRALAESDELFSGGGALGGEHEYDFIQTVPQCLTIEFIPHVVTSDDDGGDITLVVDSGGTPVTWTGAGVLATTELTPLDGRTVARGGSLRFRYEGSDDVVGADGNIREHVTDLVNHVDVVRDAADAKNLRADVPLDAPLGAQTLNLILDVTLHSTTCEGFSACNIDGTLVKSVPIDVTE